MWFLLRLDWKWKRKKQVAKFLKEKLHLPWILKAFKIDNNTFCHQNLCRKTMTVLPNNVSPTIKKNPGRRLGWGRSDWEKLLTGNTLSGEIYGRILEMPGKILVALKRPGKILDENILSAHFSGKYARIHIKIPRKNWWNAKLQLQNKAQNTVFHFGWSVHFLMGWFRTKTHFNNRRKASKRKFGRSLEEIGFFLNLLEKSWTDPQKWQEKSPGQNLVSIFPTIIFPVQVPPTRYSLEGYLFVMGWGL